VGFGCGKSQDQVKAAAFVSKGGKNQQKKKMKNEK